MKKNYTFTITLSEDDFNALVNKSLYVGMTAADLIQAFINDLIDGADTHGSDERMYADQWFNRCNFNLASDNYLLQSLGNLDSVEEFINLHKYIAEALNKLKDFEAEEPGSFWTEEDIKNNIDGLNQDIAFWKEQIDDYYSAAQKSYPYIGSLEEETKKVFQWKENYDQLTEERGGE